MVISLIIPYTSLDDDIKIVFTTTTTTGIHKKISTSTIYIQIEEYKTIKTNFYFTQ